MEPLICPQCGGAISDYSPTQNFATCGYCSTRFLISSARTVPVEPALPEYSEAPRSNVPSQAIFIAIGVVVVVFGLVALIASVNGGRTPQRTAYATPRATVSPTRTPDAPPVDPALLTFGGKGTGNGLFTDASAIAVDKNGSIYVGDGTLRLQQFDADGKFVKLLQVPSKGANYDRARSISKVGVDANGRIFVAVGGVILIYNAGADKPSRTVQVAPDYIQSFALRSDGSVLFVANNGDTETLYFGDQIGRITKRIRGFHTEPADAVFSPRETGVSSIRIAADGTGNIYSVFALASLGSYSLSYDADGFTIVRFNRDGKYVNKFVQTMSSVDIAADNQSRLYISDGGALNIYTNNGEIVSAVTDHNSIEAFALDSSNNIYLLANETVRKLPAVN